MSPPVEDKTADAPPVGRNTLVAVYNGYLVEALLHAKPLVPGLKLALRAAGHKAIDLASDRYIVHAAAMLSASDVASGQGTNTNMRKAISEDVDVENALSDASALAFEPLPGVPFSAIVGSVGQEQEGDVEKSAAALRRSMGTYLFMFAALAATHSELTVDIDGTDDALTASVLRALAATQSGGDSGAAAEIDAIMVEDIALLLVKVGEAQALDRFEALGALGASSDAEGGPFAGLMASLGGGKIADMASEISKEIDLSGASGQSAAELFSFDKLGDSNSMLGSIVSKVGSKIQSKLASGELKQDELLGEAVGFLKAFEGATGKGGGAGGMPGGGALAAALSALSGGKGKGVGKLDLGALMGAFGGGGGGGGKGADGGLDMGSLVSEVMKAAQGMSSAKTAPPTGRESLDATQTRLRSKLEKKKGKE